MKKTARNVFQTTDKGHNQNEEGYIRMIQIDTESTAVLETAQGTATLESAENEILYCAGQMARSILRIGRALKVIRDGELYKSGGFESFAAYLDARAFSGWSIGQTQGYKYVAVFERYGNRLEVFGCSNLEVLYILKDTPDDELEKLAENGQLAEMSTKEAKKYKKELDAAREQISFLEDKASETAEELKTEKEVSDKLNDDLGHAYERISKLESEIKELSNRPIEVTSVSDEELDRIRNEARAEAEKQLRKEMKNETEKAVRKAVAEEKERSEAAVVAAEDEKSGLEEENAGLRETPEKLTAEKESSDSRIKELERNLQSTEKSDTDEAMIEFKFYFSEVKNYLEKFLAVIDKVKAPGRRKKFRGAAIKFIEAIRDDLESAAEDDDED